MKPSCVRTLIVLGTVLAFQPFESFGQAGAPSAVELGDLRANVRDRSEPAGQRIIQLDALPTPVLPPPQRAGGNSSRWKWLAIGAGAAGAAVAAVIVGNGGGSVSIPIPGTGSTPTSIAPLSEPEVSGTGSPEPVADSGGSSGTGGSNKKGGPTLGGIVDSLLN